MKVIVVEDNPGIREIVVELLQRRGHTVMAFGDAESAWSWAQSHQFELAILDWGLPGMDGLELCRLLRALPDGERAAILVLTGRAEPEDLDEVVAAGADDYVTKPFKLDALEVRFSFAERQVPVHEERIRARAALTEAEQRYRALVEGLPALTYAETCDTRDKLRFISPQVEQLTGWSVEEVLADDGFWRSTLHPDEIEAVEKAKRQSCETGERFVAEYRRRCRSGEYRWFRDEAEPIRGSSGAILNWHGVVSDITDRKLAEEALRESELRHRELSVSAERQADQLRLLDRVRDTMATELELSHVFRNVVEATNDILGYAHISLYTLEDGRLVMRHQIGYTEPASIYFTMELGQGVIGTVAKTGVAQLVPDVSRAPNFLSARDDITSEICVPLHDDGRVVGAINVESTADRLLTDDDFHLLSSVAQHVSAAMTRSRLYAEAREKERLLRSVLDSVQEVVFRTDAQGRWVFLNQAWEEISGFTVEESLGRLAADFSLPERREELTEALDTLASGAAQELRGDFQVITAGGEIRWVEAHAACGGEGEERFEISGTLIDITKRKQMEEALRESQDRYRHLALHDPLTSLPNRALFMERLEQALREQDTDREGIAVLFLDLDGFKLVNDTFGHAIGDRLLMQVGQRLLRCVRPSDTIARLGGDEFAALLVNAGSSAQVAEIAERMIRALRPPFAFDGNEITLAASIGIAGHSGPDGDPSDLLRNADTALYAAKANGRGICTPFEPQMSEKVLALYREENELRRAIEHDELGLVYQPVFDLGSGAIVGAEALVRWLHPDHGILPPEEFIGRAEGTGLIVPLGLAVVRHACQEARRWQELAGRAVPAISVNLSKRQLQEPSLVADVASIMAEYAIDPASLEFEIAESAVPADDAISRRSLQGLRELGVNLVIDNFGTGFASLGWLHDLPFSAVKIDRRLTAGLGRNRTSMAIVRAIAALAQSLDLVVTAKGIETVEQLAHVRSLEIERGQGYYFSRPLPGDAILRLIAGPAPLDVGLLSVG